MQTAAAQPRCGDFPSEHEEKRREALFAPAPPGEAPESPQRAIENVAT
jgi:hypothetical protein